MRVPDGFASQLSQLVPGIRVQASWRAGDTDIEGRPASRRGFMADRGQRVQKIDGRGLPHFENALAAFGHNRVGVLNDHGDLLAQGVGNFGMVLPYLQTEEQRLGSL